MHYVCLEGTDENIVLDYGQWIEWCYLNVSFVVVDNSVSGASHKIKSEQIKQSNCN